MTALAHDNPTAAAAPRTLIVGLGKTGLSCARYLVGQGVPVAVVDSREDPPGLDALRAELPDVAVFLGGFDPALFERTEQMVVSPGVSLKEPAIAGAIARGVPAVGDVELFARAVQAPVVAVTGSNGKSTVVSMLGEMARLAEVDARLGGNIGTPVLDLLAQPQPQLYVLELSSFQLETTQSLACKAAAVLNVSPDHMDRYGDLGEYAAAKARIFRNAACKIVNADDPMAAAMASGGDVRRFTLGEPAAGEYGLRPADGGIWLACGDDPIMPLSELRVPGLHNAANALAALAVGDALGLPRAAMVNALAEFAGLPHRTQWIAEHNGVTWYNDSKGTNVGATAAALSGFPGDNRVVLIAGGEGKGADFGLLRPAVAQKARAVVLIGRDAPLLEQALDGAAPLVHARTMGDAVDQAAALARPGDVVLLSPACASFDMFTDYQARGQAFVEAVGRLTA